MVCGFSELVDACKECKATEPPCQHLAGAHVRCIKVNGCLWCDTIVPDELVLLVELHEGGGGETRKVKMAKARKI